MCSCFPGYSGSLCQYVDCSKQSLQCSNYTNLYCVYSTVATYCPELCNNAICACGFNHCLNGGTFHANNCTCECPAGFFGTTCESTDPVEPTICPPSEHFHCQNQGIFNNRTCACNCKIELSNFICQDYFLLFLLFNFEVFQAILVSFARLSFATCPIRPAATATTTPCVLCRLSVPIVLICAVRVRLRPRCQHRQSLQHYRILFPSSPNLFP